MALFPPSFIDDLKSHCDIVQIVNERVQVRRSGTTWKGLCPFHGEKTPSFHVYGDKGFFKCFGCGVGGDVIRFIELYDKISFPEAVRQLAARAGRTRASARLRPAPVCRGHSAGWFAERARPPDGTQAAAR